MCLTVSHSHLLSSASRRVEHTFPYEGGREGERGREGGKKGEREERGREAGRKKGNKEAPSLSICTLDCKQSVQYSDDSVMDSDSVHIHCRH